MGHHPQGHARHLLVAAQLLHRLVGNVHAAYIALLAGHVPGAVQGEGQAAGDIMLHPQAVQQIGGGVVPQPTGPWARR